MIDVCGGSKWVLSVIRDRLAGLRLELSQRNTPTINGCHQCQKRAGKRSIKSVLTVLAALITITCSEVRPAQTYVKDGVHLELPEGWEVFEDQISYSGRAT